MRRVLGFAVTALLVLVVPLGLAQAASAGQRDAITIETEKPFGPTPGTFSASGAFSDSGTFANTRIVFSASGAPTFGVTHLTAQFEGSLGTFTLSANIKETLTADPNVLTDDGTWVILDGTGAYDALHGQGAITGTADDNQGLISRTYAGTVHVD